MIPTLSLLRAYKIMKVLLGFILLWNLHNFTKSKQIQISINDTEVLYNVDRRSPSVTLGMGLIKYGVIKYINNTKLLTLAKALGPSYIRMGGTKSDHSHFYPGNSTSKPSVGYCDGEMPENVEFERHMQKVAEQNELKSLTRVNDAGVDNNVSYTGSDFDKLMSFVNCANWELIFGLNLLDRKNKHKNWDPTNTIELLNYTKQKKYRVNWELGNEPNSYRHKTGFEVTANEDAKAFFKINSILRSDAWWKQSKLIGPDANTMYRPKSRKFLDKFVHYARSILNAATFHQYYINSVNATIKNFTDPAILDQLKPMLKHVREIIRSQEPNLPIWIGETSSSYGGGAKGLSNTYVAGFMWLDKLGLSAINGIDIVFRQTFIEGNYAMISETFDPRPDYWLTLLYKTLVGTRVLNVSKSATGQTTEHHAKVRFYAHCTNTERTQYPLGSVTLYYMNLSQSKKKISIPQQGGQHLDKAMAYILTSSPDALNSSEVFLNGQKLQMIDIRTMPPFVPREVDIGAGEEIKLPPMSFGFIVLNDLQLQACLR